MAVTSNLQVVSDLYESRESAQLPVSTLSPGRREGDVYHFSYIDQISVVDGVCRKEEMQKTTDLIVGDEYEFPTECEQTQTEIILNGNEAAVQILDHVEIGFSRFSATRTHELTVISEVGHLVHGHVLTSPGGRLVIALGQKAKPGMSYSLIAIKAHEQH